MYYICTMRSILLLTLTLFVFSCTKQQAPNIPNPQQKTSMISFDFDGKHYEQKVEKVPTSDTGSRCENYSSIIRKIFSNGKGFFIEIQDGQNGNPNMINFLQDGKTFVGLNSHINVSTTIYDGKISGSFEGTMQGDGSIIKKLTNGIIKDVTVTNP